MKRSPEDFRAEVSAAARDVAGLVRRMAITLTSRPLWQLVGHLLLDGTTRETRDAEPFTGVGFYSRPPADGNPEAVVVFAGAGGKPLIVATRDEKTRAAVFAAAGELGPGDAALFSPAAIVIAKADGTVEIRTPGGAAVALATLADVQALRDWAAGMAYGGSGSVVPVGGAAPPNPTGTTVLKAE